MTNIYIFIISSLILVFYILRTNENFNSLKFSLTQDNVINDLSDPNDIYNDEWSGYRLGDLIKGYLLKVNDKLYLENIPKRYNGSIAHEFLQRTKGLENNSVLFDIIKNRSSKLKSKHKVCLHLRLGDVIHNSDKSGEVSYNNLKYNSSLELYDQIIKKLKYEHNVKHITIFGGAHFQISYINESLKFVNKIKNIIIQNDLKANIRIGNNPDEDFLIMCNSQIFVKAGGGFSRKIAEYVTYNNGIVIDIEKVNIKEHYKDIYSINEDDINYEIENENTILNQWIGYRLGDVIGNNSLTTEYLNKLETIYKGSIADEYHNKTKNSKRRNNFTILFDIIKRRSKYVKLRECVIHLRLGDVMSPVTHHKYKVSYEQYERLIKYLKINYSHLKEITIVGGAHYSRYLKESLIFVNSLIKLFKNNEYKINIRLGNNPDDDFLIMCNSNIFIKSGGGFSVKITDYINFNGGTVIDPRLID